MILIDVRETVKYVICNMPNLLLGGLFLEKEESTELSFKIRNPTSNNVMFL